MSDKYIKCEILDAINMNFLYHGKLHTYGKDSVVPSCTLEDSDEILFSWKLPLSRLRKVIKPFSIDTLSICESMTLELQAKHYDSSYFRITVKSDMKDLILTFDRGTTVIRLKFNRSELYQFIIPPETDQNNPPPMMA